MFSLVFNSLLGRFCGDVAPQEIASRSRMRITFETDESVTDKGWVADYWVEQCGGNFNGSSGEISTPTHPGQYHHNAYCTWRITVGSNRIVHLK